MLVNLFKSSKVWFLILLAGACTLALFVFRALTLRTPVPSAGSPIVPPKLEEALQKAKEEVLIAKTEAKIKADSERAELDAIVKIDDGVERRKKLAELLAKLPKKK